jgi:hypothetical protein
MTIVLSKLVSRLALLKLSLVLPEMIQRVVNS